MAGVRLSTLVRRMRADGPTSGSADADLLARFARSRDEAAFELLVWRHGAMVLSACRRILHQTEDAEDAFQAVFLVLARKSRSVSRGAALPAWLHRVAVRVATRLAASRRVVAPLETEPVAEPAPDSAARDELCGIVDEEIDRLPERFRRAVVLCYLEGLSAAEAAQRLGCPTGTVESRLANARKRLHAALTGRGVSLPAALAGTGTLAPEVVARTTKAAAAFARDGAAAGVANESSVRMAKGVLVMWQTRTWAAVVALVAVAATVTASFGWSEPPATQPPTQPRSADAPKPPAAVEPAAKPNETPDPRLKKEWWGEPVDFGNSGRAILRAISPDGTRVIVYHNLGMVCVDLVASKIVWCRDYKEVWPLYTAAFSPDGKLVATAEGENGANLYDAATGRPIELFAVSGARRERPYQAGFLPDGKLVVLAFATFHKAEPGQPKPQEGTHVPENTYSFSLVVCDPVTKKEFRRTHEEHATTTSTVLPRLVGRELLLETRLVWYEKNLPTKQILRYTDPLTGKTTPDLAVENDDTNTLDLSPDGKTLIAMTPGEAPRLLDRATGRVVGRLEGHKRPVVDAAYSPDGKLIATISGGTPEGYTRLYPDGKIPPGPAELILREAATDNVLAKYQYTVGTHEFGKIDFSPDGKYLLVSTGWRDKMWAWGELPFPRPKMGERVGIPTIPMPEPLKPAPTATLPLPAVPPPASGGLIADALDKLAEELPKSGRPVAQQLDALFLAALGRLPTAAELKKVDEKYRGRYTPDVFRALLADLAKTPEFEAHVKMLQKRLPSTVPVPGGPPIPTTPFPNLSGGQPTIPPGLSGFPPINPKTGLPLGTPPLTDLPTKKP
jgi:RNA polymerase sigma factor (sigma-70 family)